jgi:hypothetical protein
MILLLTTLALAGEHKLDPAALPAAVTAAVQARVPGAIVVGASQEGKAYEARVTLAERRLDLTFSADGTWLEEEETVAADALPDAVKGTLAARWKGWTIARAERAETPKGTNFEVVVRSGERSAEVALTEVGVVKRVEAGDEEDEDGEEAGH